MATVGEIAELMGGELPKCRYLVYSDPFGGKSTFAATFEKPMVVACFDPYLKESPYLAKGYYNEPELDGNGTPYRDVVSEHGEVLVRIYYFHDEVPERPQAYKRFQKFMHGFDAAERRCWKTLVIDSVSAMNRACKLMHEFDLNPDYKDPRKWYADTADYMERMLTRFASMNDLNLVLLCHISRKTDEASGSILRMVKLPGRLGMDGPDGFPEIYRMFNDRTTGTPKLQTRRGTDSYLAGSQFLNAPSPCEPRFSALWANFVPRNRPRPAPALATQLTNGAAVEAAASNTNPAETPPAIAGAADTTEPAEETATNE